MTYVIQHGNEAEKAIIHRNFCLIQRISTKLNRITKQTVLKPANKLELLTRVTWSIQHKMEADN